MKHVCFRLLPCKKHLIDEKMLKLNTRGMCFRLIDAVRCRVELIGANIRKFHAIKVEAPGRRKNLLNRLSHREPLHGF